MARCFSEKRSVSLWTITLEDDSKTREQIVFELISEFDKRVMDFSLMTKLECLLGLAVSECPTVNFRV